MVGRRRKFQGVINILSFNRHFYIWSTIVIIITLTVLYPIDAPNLYYWIIVAGFLYGICIPLIVSAYVYDLSGYYQLSWLDDLDLNYDKRLSLVNINAGFDEMSFLIKGHFNNSDLKVFDFYDSENHTEPAIVRARKVSKIYPGTLLIKSSNIPLPSNAVDFVFLIAAAHEIRSTSERIAFLKECKRICKPDGRIIVLEHLRDLPNFLAFTIGFTHFYSLKSWQHDFENAELNVINHVKHTPFMSLFLLQPKT